MTQENSVLVALQELQDLEEERIETEVAARRAEEEAKAAEKARAAEEAAARDRAEELAREEKRAHAAELARLDVQQAVSTAVEDSEKRIETMRDELRAIRQERELLHQRMLEGIRDEPRKRAPWGGIALGLSVLLSVGLSAALVMEWNRPAPVPQVILREVPVAMPSAAPAPAPVEAEVVAPDPEPEVEVVAAPRPRVRRTRPRRPRPVTMERDGLGGIDDCGNDPLCGI